MFTISYDYLPDDMWLEIIKYLNVQDKYTLTKTSWRLRYLTNTCVKDEERFRFNLNSILSSIEYKKLCLKQANSILYLTNKDIEYIPVEYKRNLYGYTHLYDIHNLIEKCIEKYKTWENFEKRRKKRANRSNNIKQGKEKRYTELLDALKKINLEHCINSFESKNYLVGKTKNTVKQVVQTISDKENRRIELVSRLNEVGLNLRTDSTQCNSYINSGRGISGENVEQIVIIMRQMDWLFKNTRYIYTINEIKNSYRNRGEWYETNVVLLRAKRNSVREWCTLHPNKMLPDFMNEFK